MAGKSIHKSSDSGVLPGSLTSEDKFAIVIAGDKELNFLYLEAVLEKMLFDRLTLLQAKKVEEAIRFCNSILLWDWFQWISKCPD
jgi:hypothetical protein